MDAFTELCVESLSPLGPVRVGRMFGGQGIYVDGLFMALIIGSQLYLKVDDVTRERFVSAGCSPFTYTKRDGEQVIVSYYRPPEETLESPPLMLPWARLALEAALRAANAKVKKKSVAAVAKWASESNPGEPATKRKPAAKKTAARRR
ncbi:MAG: TfoX family protein [Rubrivivax sp.]|nr:MAG: TfoX family protein [Rubrivivax sp.]